MDCSNTTRWLYEVTAASSCRAPRRTSTTTCGCRARRGTCQASRWAWPDTRYLAGHLKPGDLLFWENTYKPERQPPITHVMIFLGGRRAGALADGRLAKQPRRPAQPAQWRAGYLFLPALAAVRPATRRGWA
ncbi:MAG: hypothetical protein WDO13_08775 [Verrucomicrobiota bacterium]